MPENIPHSTSPHTGNGGINLPAPHHPNGQGTSPGKDGSFIHRETSLNRETSVDDEEMEGAKDGLETKAEEAGKAVPIRQS